MSRFRRWGEETEEKGGEAKDEAPRSPVGDAVEYWNEYFLKIDDPKLTRLFEFECENFRDFDPDVEEFTLDQERLYREYCRLFEGACENHLRANNVTPEEFARVMRRDLKAHDRRRRDDAVAFLRIIDKADSFERFAESMRDATRQARWLESPD